MILESLYLEMYVKKWRLDKRVKMYVKLFIIVRNELLIGEWFSKMW